MKKLLSVVLLCLSISTFAQNVFKEYVDGQVYVKFRSGTIKALNKENPNNINLNKIDVIKDLIGKYGINKALKPFYQANDDINLTHILQLEFTNVNKVNSLISDLQKLNVVEYAEKVMLMTTHATPNDPSFGSHLTQINAQNAWNIFNSTANGNSNITVAIVDNAISIVHQDLSANVWVNPGEIPNNGIDDDNNGYIDDINGWDVADGDNNPNPPTNGMNHGTHCAGIAGARTDNNLGIASIGWNIKLIAVKAQFNSGNNTAIAAGYQGIIYAAKAKARIISCSWGGTGAPSAAAQSVIDYAWNKGCIIIVSAGNDNNSVLHYPAAYNNVYSVASVSGSNVKSSFSCFGTWVDISAPGNSINSTLPGNNYGQQSGTSMACPMVAGLAGLMLSKYPYMTQSDVLNCISSTAANIYTISGNSAYVTPQQLGAGRIEAFAAMQCAASYTGNLPIGNFYTLTRNTCPNTPITFIDSSMYNPLNWSWSFPGATPATSTSSNPTVSYASPGVYNITMTVSNTNGSNVKVRNSYITIAGPVNLPLVEGFQATTFVPTNWSTFNIDNDSIFWKRKLGVGGFTVNAAAACALFDDYNQDVGGARDEIRTPKYNFSNVVNAKIRFDVAYKQYDNTANITPQNPYSDTLELKLTNNCGTSWTSIYNKGGATLSTSPGTIQASTFIPLANEWRTDSINISSLAALQPNVMISFVNRGHYGQAMYVDNINIFLPAPSVTVNSPSFACAGTPISFTNNTTGAAGYTWTTMPPAAISAPNGTNTNITFAGPGTYSVTLTANNGSVLSILTKTISIATQPTVSLITSTTNICSGTNVTLTASGANSYSWSTGSTASSIIVTPTVTTNYSVNGINSSACQDLKTSLVNVTLTPAVVVNNQTICAGGTATINATGASSYSWSTGSTSNPLMVSPSSNTVYTIIGFNNTCTNTKTVSVTIGSSITIIPAASTPTICTGGTVNLTASGASTFTWQPVNLNGNSIVVNPSSSTVYTVSGSNAGCNGSATIAVNIISPPVLLLTPSTSSVCAGGSSTINATGYSTYTWMPGNLSGSSNAFSPTSTQIYTVSGTIGNCFGNATATIGIVNIPTVSVSGGTVICFGNNANLTASGAATYSWSSGNTTPTVALSPATTTTYIVTGYNSTCTNTIAVTVSVNPNPTLAVSSSSNPSCIGAGVNLTASGATTYSWSSGGTFPTVFVAPTITTNYTITGTTNGCSSQTVFTQVVNNCGGVGIDKQSITNTLLQIYPNPTNDYINITFAGKVFNYEIVDNLGRVITNNVNVTETAKLNVSEFAKGVYYIIVTNESETIRRKLIID